MTATAESLTTAYEKFIEAEERRSLQGQRQYVYASAWAACTRQMALDMLRPDVKPPFQADTLANFRRGRDRERDLVADLTRVGRHSNPPFELVGAQERFELRDKKGRIVIVGKVDTRIKFQGQKGSDPVEIKSFHPNLIQGVKQFSDMFANRWTRRGAFQLLAYLLGSNEERGWLLLDRPGIPRPLEVRLLDHLDKIEDFLKRAEVAMDARESIRNFSWTPDKPSAEDAAAFEAFLPPYIDDPSECRVCPFFGGACNPGLSFAGASIVTDEVEIQKVERLAAIQDMPEIEEHVVLDKWAKSRFRGVLNAIVGKCVVQGKWQKDTKYELTDEAKAQIDAIKAPFAKRVEQGKWVMTVTKVSD